MFSFVIPVLNEEERLPDLLGDLRRRFPDAELLVVDGGSSDGSVGVAMGIANVVLLGSRGRAAQMNLGAQSASGSWLCFLHADTTPTFDQAALAAGVERGGRWTFCKVRLRGRSRGLAMVSFFMNVRSRVTSVSTGDQLLVVHRDLFEAVGGFAPIPLMEDVDICKRLRRVAPAMAPDLWVESSGRRWDEQGLAKTIGRMWALRLAYWLGVAPQRLWQHYYGRGALRGPASPD